MNVKYHDGPDSVYEMALPQLHSYNDLILYFKVCAWSLFISTPSWIVKNRCTNNYTSMYWTVFGIPCHCDFSFENLLGSRGVRLHRVHRLTARGKFLWSEWCLLPLPTWKGFCMRYCPLQYFEDISLISNIVGSQEIEELILGVNGFYQIINFQSLVSMHMTIMSIKLIASIFWVKVLFFVHFHMP